MNLFLGITEGFREIWAHKFRSFLTMLGVILGVASLMGTFALTAGMAAGMQEFIQQIGGMERVDVQDAPVPPQQEDKAELSPGRTYQDAVALRRSAPLVAYVSPEVWMGGQPGTVKITRLNFSTNPRLVGAEPDYLITDKHVLASGRFIHPLDLERQHRVIVLGRALVDELWPGNDDSFFPLGESVRINGWNFTVIGVFDRYMDSRQKKEKELGLDKAREARRKERGTAKQRPSRNSGGYQWKNTVAAIPLSTMQAIFKSSNVVNNVDQGPDIKLSRLTIQVVDPRQLDSALQQIRNVLTMTHRGIRDFGFETREDMIESIDRSVTATRLSGGLIAGLSLLVGGLGITNIMLASISERIREIGIRRAVGARASDIFIQILMESFVLAMIGGFFGLIAGWGMTELLKVISPVENNPIIESSSILISLAFAMLVGILAGLYPAFQASQLSPIQALRYE